MANLRGTGEPDPRKEARESGEFTKSGEVFPRLAHPDEFDPGDLAAEPADDD